MTDEPVAMEPARERLKRFQDGPPSEIILTLTNSINNFFNPEIRRASESNSWSLAIMGIHAVALTISEGFVGLTGEAGYCWFLRSFMDQQEVGGDFSTVGAELHRWRNVLAHQWIASAGHRIGLDLEQSEGWRRAGDTLVLNPARYHEAYEHAFEPMSTIWDGKLLTSDELAQAKVRLIEKYVRS